MEILHGEVIGRIIVGAEALEVNEDVVFQLVVHVVPHFHLPVGVVLLFELHTGGIGPRQDPHAGDQRNGGDHGRRQDIGPDNPVIADSRREHGHHLRVLCHLGREENHGEEHEHRGILVDEERHEVHVVVEDNLVNGHVLAHEILNLLADVKHHDENGKEKQ